MPETDASPTPISSLFLGTPPFAVPSLRALATHPDILIHAVITRPDRRGGRGMKITPPAVKSAATELSLPLFQPDTLNEHSFRNVIEQFPPLDLIFVVAYGRKIPSWLLHFPRWGCINLHPSLLPRYRGGAPIRRALFQGDTVTGVTTMYLDEGWDTGDLIFQEQVFIPDEADYGALSEILSQQGAHLLLKTALSIADNSAPRRKQDETLATHEPLLRKADEWIDWTQTALDIHNRVRGLSPEPGAHTRLGNKSIRILRTLPETPLSESMKKQPGEIVLADRKDGILVATGGKDLLRLVSLQPAGKKPMSSKDFLNGHPVRIGDFLSGGETTRSA